MLKQKHLNMLNSMINFALIYQKQEFWRKVKELNVQMIKTKKMLKQKHLFTLKNINNFILILKNQRRWNEIEELNMQMMKTKKKMLKQKHSNTLNNIINFVSTYCEGVYRGFVLVCKKFDIGEYWGLAHFRKHTQLNATKEIGKFAWNALYLIAATENFFLII